MDRQIGRVVAKRLSLPEEAVLKLPVLTLYGQEEVVMENAKVLLTYTGELLRVRTSDGILLVEGEGLTIEHWKEHTMVVKGKLQKLCWEEETR